jgi:hypothetical protein
MVARMNVTCAGVRTVLAAGRHEKSSIGSQVRVRNSAFPPEPRLVNRGRRFDGNGCWFVVGY